MRHGLDMELHDPHGDAPKKEGEHEDPNLGSLRGRPRSEPAQGQGRHREHHHHDAVHDFNPAIGSR